MVLGRCLSVLRVLVEGSLFVHQKQTVVRHVRLHILSRSRSPVLGVLEVSVVLRIIVRTIVDGSMFFRVGFSWEIVRF